MDSILSIFMWMEIIWWCSMQVQWISSCHVNPFAVANIVTWWTDCTVPANNSTCAQQLCTATAVTALPLSLCFSPHVNLTVDALSFHQWLSETSTSSTICQCPCIFQLLLLVVGHCAMMRRQNTSAKHVKVSNVTTEFCLKKNVQTSWMFSLEMWQQEAADETMPKVLLVKGHKLNTCSHLICAKHHTSESTHTKKMSLWHQKA